MSSTPANLSAAQRRRYANAAAGACINENKKKTHGAATFGVRCRACYAVHKGKEADDMTITAKYISVRKETYEAIRSIAMARGISTREVVDVMLDAAISEPVEPVHVPVASDAEHPVPSLTWTCTVCLREQDALNAGIFCGICQVMAICCACEVRSSEHVHFSNAPGETFTCALCTDLVTCIPSREPLGRGDALVKVCTACHDDHPREGEYSFGGGGSQVGAKGKRAAGAL